MASLAGMTQRESDICTGYWVPINGSTDLDHDEAALNLVRQQLGADISDAAREFVARQQEHIDVLREAAGR